MKLCPLELVDGDVAFMANGSAWLGLRIEPRSAEMLNAAEKQDAARDLYQLVYSRIDEGLFVVNTHEMHIASYVSTMAARASSDPALREAYTDYVVEIEGCLKERPSFTSTRYLFVKLHESRGEGFKEAARSLKEKIDHEFGLSKARFTSKRLAAMHAEAGEMTRHTQSCIEITPMTTDDWHIFVEQQYRRGTQPRLTQQVAGVVEHEGELREATGRLAKARNCIVAEGKRHIEVHHEDELESAQAFLCFSRLPEGEYPGAGGDWIYRLLWSGIPVDCAVSFTRKSAQQLLAELRSKKARLADQRDQLMKVGHEVPSDLTEAIEEATDVEAVTKRTKAPSINFSTVFCVYGANAERVSESAKQLKAFYETDQFELARPLGDQAKLFSSFFPGGARVPDEYVKRASPTYLAASGLHMTHEVGTNGGVYAGRVIWSTSNLPVKGYGSVVSLDPSESQRKWSPAVAITGTLGGGKTAAIKACLMYPLLLRGTRAIVFDPKQSEYSQLTKVAALKDRIALIRPDRRSQVSFDPLALIEDRDTKESVAASFLQMLVGIKPESDLALYVDQAVEWAIDNDSRLAGAVAWLQKSKKAEAKRLAEHLTRYAKAPFAHLAFGENTVDVQKQITIFDLEAMSLPDRETLVSGARLTREQHLSVCTFYLMGAFALEFARTSDPRVLDQIVVDEAHNLSSFPQGQELLRKTIRQGRSMNVQIVLSSQSAEDLLGLEDHVPTRLAFKQESTSKAQLEASSKFVCGHVSEDVMETIGSLGVGQCVVRDHRGRIGLVQMELVSQIQEVLAQNPATERAGRLESAA